MRRLLLRFFIKMGEVDTITVRFLLPSSDRGETAIEASRVMTVRDVLKIACEELGLDQESLLSEQYLIIVDGTEIRHLQRWDTMVSSGSTVSVVAGIAGG